VNVSCKWQEVDSLEYGQWVVVVQMGECLADARAEVEADLVVFPWRDWTQWRETGHSFGPRLVTKDVAPPKIVDAIMQGTAMQN
jgi:hypothetical protein